MDTLTPESTKKDQQTKQQQQEPQPAESLTGGNVSDIPQTKSFEEQCRDAICPSCTIKQEAEEIRLRALAEMDNVKKRLNREHEERVRYATESVLKDLLPALDNLDLAIRYGSHAEACKDMLTGVQMTLKLMLDALKNHGLTPVGEIGEVFNPEIHEAVTYEERDDLEANHVSTIMQKGYMLKNHLLRPAKVAVSKLPVSITSTLKGRAKH